MFRVEDVAEKALITKDRADELVGQLQPEVYLTSAHPIIESFAETNDIDALLSFAVELEETIKEAMLAMLTRPHVDIHMDSGNSRILLVRSAAFLLNLTSAPPSLFRPHAMPDGLPERARNTCNQLACALAIVAIHKYISNVHVPMASSLALEASKSGEEDLDELWVAGELFLSAIDRDLAHRIQALSSVRCCAAGGRTNADRYVYSFSRARMMCARRISVI